MPENPQQPKFEIEPPSSRTGKDFQIEPPDQKDASAIPGVPHFLHALGLPASMDEYRARAEDVGQHPLKAAWEMGIKPVLMAGPAGAMVKEGYRAVSNPRDPMAGVHAMSALNPFAAPVVDAMTEQGLGTAQANATGIMGATSLAAGVASPRIRPALRTVGRTMETNAPRVAEFAAHPIASTVRPVVRGAIRSGGRVLQRMAGPEAPGVAAETAGTAPAQALPTEAPRQASEVPAIAPANPAPLRPPRANPAPERWTPEARRQLLEDMGHYEGTEPVPSLTGEDLLKGLQQMAWKKRK